MGLTCEMDSSADENGKDIGAPGFEPGTSCSQSRRANRTALRPVTGAMIVTDGSKNQTHRGRRIRELAGDPRRLGIGFYGITYLVLQQGLPIAKLFTSIQRREQG